MEEELEVLTPKENDQSDHRTNRLARLHRLRLLVRRLRRFTRILVAITAILGAGLFTLLLFMQDTLQQRRKYLVLVPLYASSQEYLEFIGQADGHFPKASFKRKVSLDTLYSLEAAKSAWFAQTPKDKYLSPDNFQFYYFPEGYDTDSYSAAFHKAIETAKKDGFEVVGAIGNITSTATKAYGSLYSEQGLPLILPMATATNLADYLRGTCHLSILRLLPSNDKQAEMISNFLIEQHAFRVIVAKDLSNPAYSEDLVEGFRAHFVTRPFELQRKQNQIGLPMYLVDSGQIVAVLPTGGEYGAPVAYSGLKEMNANALVMVGMTDFALETLAQARASNLAAKFTIFTDGAIDEDLLPQVNRLISDQPTSSQSQRKSKRAVQNHDKRVPIDGAVYIAFPLEDKMPSALYENVFKDFHVLDRELGGQRNLEMTHALYVVDSAQIMLTILRESVADQSYSWFQKARTPIGKTMEDWNAKKATESRFSCYNSGRSYAFDGGGNAVEIDYHLYRATLPGVKDGDLNRFMDQKTRDQQRDYWSAINWVHDNSCPVEVAKHSNNKAL